MTNSGQNKLRREALDLVWVNFAGEPEVAVAGLQARGRTTGFCRRIAIQPLFTGHCLQEAPSSDAPNRQRSDIVRCSMKPN